VTLNKTNAQHSAGPCYS